MIFRAVTLCLAIFSCIFCCEAVADADAAAAAREARLEWLAAHPLRVVFNNDGGDLSRVRDFGDGVVADFLSHRHNGLKDKQVDVISYTTQTSPVGITTSESDIADTYYRDAECQATTALKAMRACGTDPLKASVEFAHANGMLGFWGMRMNDCHDSFNGGEDLFAPWKSRHPELLVATRENPPPFAYWTALDYGQPEVRELTVKVFREGMDRYDIDGLDMDFCRHWCLFKSAAWGGVPSQSECDAITEMLRQIRRHGDRLSAQRGRPFFIMVRVMDSVEACRAQGIDLPAWCSEGLVDIVAGGSEVRLNHPTYWAELSRQYPQVLFLMTQTESQISGEHPIIQRNYNPMNFRGQAAASYYAGVPGVYAFNQYFPSHSSACYLAEIDNSAKLLQANKMYYFSQVFLPAARFGKGWVKFQIAPSVTPAASLSMPFGAPLELPLYLGEEAPGAEYTLLLDLRESLAVDELKVQFNGVELPEGHPLDGLAAFDVPAELVKPGFNQVAMAATTASAPEEVLRGDELLSQGKNQGTWRRLFGDRGFVPGKSEAITDGGYLLADVSEEGISNLARPLETMPTSKVTIDFEAKVIAASEPEAVQLRIANGLHAEALLLSPEAVTFKNAKISHPFDAATFHRYTIRMDGDALALFLDGDFAHAVLETTMTTATSADAALVAQAREMTSWLEDNSLIVGSLSQTGTGAAIYRNMTIASSQAGKGRLYDGALLAVHQPSANDLPASLCPLVKVPEDGVTRCFSLRPNAMDGWEKSSFNNVNLKIGGDAIYMDHRVLGPMLSHSLPDALGRFVKVEFDFKPIEDDCPKGQLQALVTINDNATGSWLAGYRLHKDGVQFLDDPMVKYQPDAQGVVRVRILLDTTSGVADLYVGDDARPILRHRCFGLPKRTAQSVAFGDGSVAVIGQCELYRVDVTEYVVE